MTIHTWFWNESSCIFFHKSKATRVFQQQEDTNVVVIIALSSTKLCLSFWNVHLGQRYLGKHISCSWNQSYFLMKSDKTLLSPKQNKRDLKHIFVEERLLRTIMSKETFPPNIPFWSSKLLYFFKSSFWEKWVLSFFTAR